MPQARRAFALVLALSSSYVMPAFAQAATTLAVVPGRVAVTPPTAALTPAPVVLSRHVIVVSIDGLRPDAIEAADARVLQRLLADGSGTIDARTILPSRTLPSHTSMVTGVLPETHGITWNSAEPDFGYVTVPTMFQLAHDAGYRTAAFVSKKKFQHIFPEGTLDATGLPGGAALPASRTVSEAIRYLEHEKPNLLFVHIAEPDALGHMLGWMGFGYRWAVREADAAVGKIIETADETFGEGNYTLIVTADHGGHGHGHGTDSVEDQTIPWISFGQGIRRGHSIEADVETMDTAATVLTMLGVLVPAAWDGVAVQEALIYPAVAAATGTDAPRR